MSSFHSPTKQTRSRAIQRRSCIRATTKRLQFASAILVDKIQLRRIWGVPEPTRGASSAKHTTEAPAQTHRYLFSAISRWNERAKWSSLRTHNQSTSHTQTQSPAKQQTILLALDSFSSQFKNSCFNSARCRSQMLYKINRRADNGDGACEKEEADATAAKPDTERCVVVAPCTSIIHSNMIL